MWKELKVWKLPDWIQWSSQWKDCGYLPRSPLPAVSPMPGRMIPVVVGLTWTKTHGGHRFLFGGIMWNWGHFINSWKDHTFSLKKVYLCTRIKFILNHNTLKIQTSHSWNLVFIHPWQNLDLLRWNNRFYCLTMVPYTFPVMEECPFGYPLIAKLLIP